MIYLHDYSHNYKLLLMIHMNSLFLVLIYRNQLMNIQYLLQQMLFQLMKPVSITQHLDYLLVVMQTQTKQEILYLINLNKETFYTTLTNTLTDIHIAGDVNAHYYIV